MEGHVVVVMGGEGEGRGTGPEKQAGVILEVWVTRVLLAVGGSVHGEGRRCWQFVLGDCTGCSLA